MSGAFIEWLLARDIDSKLHVNGLELVKSLYRNNDLDDLDLKAGTLENHVKGFQKELAALSLPDYAVGFAQKNTRAHPSFKKHVILRKKP